MAAPRPFTLVAELTYRCPLHCTYCSNPLEHSRDELDAATWERVIDDAASRGVVQLDLTGGEPLQYRALQRLVAKGRAHALHVSLITSGVPVTRDRLAALRDAGLDHVKLSLQHADPDRADRIAGARVFERKLATAAWIKELGIPLTIHVVLHRDNIAAIAAIIALARSIGAERLELENVQYLGVALANLSRLRSDRHQLDRAIEVAAHARDALAGVMQVDIVDSDATRRDIIVAPDGRTR